VWAGLLGAGLDFAPRGGPPRPGAPALLFDGSALHTAIAEGWARDEAEEAPRFRHASGQKARPAARSVPLSCSAGPRARRVSNLYPVDLSFGVYSRRDRVNGRLRREPACADRARAPAHWQADPKDGRPLRLRCAGRAGFAPLECAASTLLERAVFWSGSGPDRAGVVRVPAGGGTLYCVGPHEFRCPPTPAGAPRAARGSFSSAV
jgi:hypothetical protein